MTAYNPLPSHGIPHLLMRLERERQQSQRKRAQYGFCAIVLASLVAYAVVNGTFTAMDAEQQRQQAMTEQKR